MGVRATLWRDRRNGRYRVLSSPMKQFAANICTEQQPHTSKLRLSRQLDKSVAMKRTVLTRWDHVPFFVFRTTWSYCNREKYCKFRDQMASCRWVVIRKESQSIRLATHWFGKCSIIVFLDFTYNFKGSLINKHHKFPSFHIRIILAVIWIERKLWN